MLAAALMYLQIAADLEEVSVLENEVQLFLLLLVLQLKIKNNPVVTDKIHHVMPKTIARRLKENEYEEAGTIQFISILLSPIRLIYKN